MSTQVLSQNVQLQNIHLPARLTDLPDEIILRVIALSGDKSAEVKIAYNLSAVCSRFRQLLVKQFLPSIQKISSGIITPLSLSNNRLACVALTSMFSHTCKVKEINLGGLSPDLLTEQCLSALADSAINTLTKVNLAYSTVTDSCVRPLLRCPKLRYLVLPSCNRITGTMFGDENIKAPLEFLDLSWVHALTEEGVKNIAKVSTIKELILTGCEAVRRRSLHAFFTNDIRFSLHTIHLCYCPIPEDSIANLLNNTPNLKTLALAEDICNVWSTGELNQSVIAILKDRFPNVEIIYKTC